MRASLLAAALLAGCGTGPVMFSVSAPAGPIELNDLHKGGVLLPAEHACAQPKVTVNGVPLGAPAAAVDGHVRIAGDVLWETLAEMLEDVRGLCEVDRVYSLRLDCTGQAPVFGEGPFESSVAVVDVTFRKSIITKAYATPTLENVSPLAAVTAWFGPYGVDAKTFPGALTLRDGEGTVEIVDEADRTELVFLPAQPLQPGRTYSARWSVGFTGLRTAASGCINPAGGRDNVSWSFTTRAASEPPFQVSVSRGSQQLRVKWDSLGGTLYRLYAVPTADALSGGTLLATTRDSTTAVELNAGPCFRVDAEPLGRTAVSSTVACVE